MTNRQTDSPVNVALTYQGKPRSCGFRFSIVDGVAVVICAAASYWAWPAVGSLSLVFPYVLGHFFLFCNVFRVRRWPELIWAGVFVINFGIWMALGDFVVMASFLAQMPVTIIIVLFEFRCPTYHGIFSHSINARNIDSYLSGEI